MTNRLSIAFGVLIAVLVAGLGTAAFAPTPVVAQTATPTATATATATPTAAPTPAMSGTLPRAGGIGLGVWQGGRVEDVPAAATPLGCRLLALWLINNGEFVGFVYGAPDFVNAPFRAAYPIVVSAGAVIVVCGAGSVPAATATPTPTATPVPSAALAVKESMLIVGFIFQRHLELPIGSSVTWKNLGGSTLRFDPVTRAPVINPATGLQFVDSSAVPHTVTADDGSFDSGPITGGAEFTFTFTKAGTFAYRCTIHPFMRESVVIR